MRQMTNNSPFFVRKVVFENGRKLVHWLDINSGVEYEALDIPFDQAQHGLCETMGTSVYKSLSKRLVLAPIGDCKERMVALKKLRPITVDSHGIHNHRIAWRFQPLDIYEVFLGLEEGLSEHQLATRVCSPLEAIENLLKVIERRGLMEKVLGGDGDGGNPPERRTGDTEGLSYDLRY